MPCAQECVTTFVEIDVRNENIYGCCKIETKADKLKNILYRNSRCKILKQIILVNEQRINMEKVISMKYPYNRK